ncbi:cytochrome c-type biogenesis protein CcsB [Natronocella acetinitrilica]|uniref:Cytochrome c-type biogenesis protein CcsB n=1 Tax=Natronocella acetinitrilica TaxID=414046 RepID=A0AAE3G0H7_9GAMM|nr:c-type cytochrome biogenesis protein CcsB [Natronocella acetinitrilica]MCP1673450.1 cytochrome c-type biogenesis protein CcsB [Natronocella acetinitrilica]
MSTPQETMVHDFDDRGFLRRLSWFDWLWAAAFLVGTIYASVYFAEWMDGYEQAILYGTYGVTVWIGWNWKAARIFTIVVTLVTLFAVSRYPTLSAGTEDFFLNYLVSSQSAIMWMCALFPAAMVFYFVGLIARAPFPEKVGTALMWGASGAALVGLLVRWWESYLIAPEVGRIPVTNLYEVFVLFGLCTGLLYLYYEERHRTRALGGFVGIILTASVGFLLWYHFDRQAHEIDPLIPALQSWWMKIHVPTNFVAYGAFSIAAMIGVAYLFYARNPEAWERRGLPSAEVMDDIMYKNVALGFVFFTVATILGALWAAEAWGGYWSWDPKETWSLILWLNYAAWLHLRFTKGWRGVPMAIWAIIGLLVTTFTFLGVNIFLSGLHSYGEL